MEIQERCRVESFQVEGPRRAEFSNEPEVRCTPIQSFKNPEASVWLHSFDLLMCSELIPTDFFSDIRKAAAVNMTLLIFPFCSLRS